MPAYIIVALGFCWLRFGAAYLPKPKQRRIAKADWAGRTGRRELPPQERVSRTQPLSLSLCFHLCHTHIRIIISHYVICASNMYLFVVAHGLA